MGQPGWACWGGGVAKRDFDAWSFFAPPCTRANGGPPGGAECGNECKAMLANAQLETRDAEPTSRMKCKAMLATLSLRRETPSPSVRGRSDAHAPRLTHPRAPPFTRRQEEQAGQVDRV